MKSPPHVIERPIERTSARPLRRRRQIVERLALMSLLPVTMIVTGKPVAHASGAPTATPRAFQEAIDLIHAFSGSGDELQRAMRLADDLAVSHAHGGYSEVLQAEAMSTWQVDQDGQPLDLRAQVLELCDAALSKNPRLALAHVAKGRVLLRASQNAEAEEQIQHALRLEPLSTGATFLRADMYRRTERFADAERWYRKFIALTDNPARKSNGYGWIASMYQQLAFANLDNNARYIAQANEAFAMQLQLDPTAAWKSANYAIFLNNFGNDYDRAELYAQRALRLVDFPMARYHLAAARFQRLANASPPLDPQTLALAVANITSSTSIELADAVRYAGFSSIIQNRLAELQRRLPDNDTSPTFRSEQVLWREPHSSAAPIDSTVLSVTASMLAMNFRSVGVGA